jgi:hypothetical protein
MIPEYILANAMVADPERKEKKFHVLRGLWRAVGFCWSLDVSQPNYRFSFFLESGLDPDSGKPGY